MDTRPKFASINDAGLPRLFRFVDDMDNNLLCVLDAEQNILVINRTLWALLSKEDQRAVERTHEPALELYQLERAA